MTKLAALLRQMKVTNILLRARNGIQTGLFGSASRRTYGVHRWRQDHPPSGASHRVRPHVGARSDSDGAVDARHVREVPQGEEAMIKERTDGNQATTEVSASTMGALRKNPTNKLAAPRHAGAEEKTHDG